MLDFGESR